MNLTPRMDRLDQNLIMNAGMEHWQRATSFTFGNNTTAYHNDRFLTYATGFSTLNGTVSRSTDVPTISESKYKFNYSYQYQVNTSEATPASAYCQITQRIEPVVFSPFIAEDLKLSFWVKSSIAGKYTAHLYTATGTPYQFYVTTFDVDSASTWEKKVISIPKMNQPTLFSTSPYMEVAIQLANGSSNTGDTNLNQWVTDVSGEWAASGHVNLTETTSATFNITGIKLGQNNGASTDYEFSLHNGSYQTDLVACGRYFETSYDHNTAIGTATYNGVHFYSITLLNSAIRTYSFYINYRYPKRNIPTTIVYSPNTGGANLIGTAAGDKTASYNDAGEKGIRVQTSDTAAQTTMTWAAHYSADSEL